MSGLLFVALAASSGPTLSDVPGPQGVRGRTSDNSLIRACTTWQPAHTLTEGVAKTYVWIARQVAATEPV